LKTKSEVIDGWRKQSDEKIEFLDTFSVFVDSLFMTGMELSKLSNKIREIKEDFFNFVKDEEVLVGIFKIKENTTRDEVVSFIKNNSFYAFHTQLVQLIVVTNEQIRPKILPNIFERLSGIEALSLDCSGGTFDGYIQSINCGCLRANYKFPKDSERIGDNWDSVHYIICFKPIKPNYFIEMKKIFIGVLNKFNH